MDLTKMTRADLASLQRELHLVASAADLLAEALLVDPEISFTAEETVIRILPLSVLQRNHDPVDLLERHPPEAGEFVLDPAGPVACQGGGQHG